MYRLVVCDMDGTLLNKCDFISEENINTIIKLKEKGCHFAIATGRVFTSARIYARQLGLITPIIANNGALIKDLREDGILYGSPMPREISLEIFKMLRNFNVYMTFYSEDIYYAEKMEKNVVKYIEYNDKVNDKDRVKIEIIDNPYEWYKENADITLYKLQANSGNPEVLSRVRDELQKIPSISLSTSWSTNIEIMNGGVSKGNAVKRLAQILGVNREEIICIGDNENDISMFQYAGLGVAMGNASEYVKKHADFITLSNEEDGVAHALKKFINC